MLENRRRFLHAVAELDLTPPQAFALRHIDPDRPATMSELAEILFCDASNVTGLVDRLEARGIVERRSDERDRRVKTVAFTPAGRRLRKRVVALMNEPPPAIAGLSREDQETLLAIFRRAVASGG
jgi:MarR family transcriptional regulator, organic hydroperoxide resistance regulator